MLTTSASRHRQCFTLTSYRSSTVFCALHHKENTNNRQNSIGVSALQIATVGCVITPTLAVITGVPRPQICQLFTDINARGCDSSLLSNMKSCITLVLLLRFLAYNAFADQDNAPDFIPINGKSYIKHCTYFL